MPYENVEALPQDTQSLPQEAKQIFMAAFNAATSDGFSEDGARDVAWSSVKTPLLKIATASGTSKLNRP